MARSRYWKGAQRTLQGPHFNQPGQLYLPGTEHTAPLEQFAPYGQGIHFTSHPRVAGRWAEVILEVEVLGTTFLIPHLEAPRYRRDIPRSLAMGKYNKYRTDRLRIIRIAGLATYGRDRNASHAVAAIAAHEVNKVLDRFGLQPVGLQLGPPWETLRDDGFNIWKVEDPNAVHTAHAWHSPPAPRQRLQVVTIVMKTAADPARLRKAGEDGFAAIASDIDVLVKED